ncbi:MAG: LytR/AlgR family response regulator transcription factor [Gemmatimonadales bacterium]
MLAALQVILRPGVTLDPGLLLVLHVPHWSSWAVFTIVVARLDRRLVPLGFRARLAAHLAICAGVILTHAMFVAGWDVLIFLDRLQLHWLTILGRHLRSSALLEVLGYALVLSVVLRRRTPVLDEPGPREIPVVAPGPSLDALTVRSGNAVERVPLAEISSFEAAGNYVRIFSNGRRLVLRQSLSALERELDDRFIRIHRSRIVNLAHVTRVVSLGRRRKQVILRDGRELPASVSGWQRVRALLPRPPGQDMPPG